MDEPPLDKQPTKPDIILAQQTPTVTKLKKEHQPLRNNEQLFQSVQKNGSATSFEDMEKKPTLTNKSIVEA